jgi:hypothetical protein
MGATTAAGAVGWETLAWSTAERANFAFFRAHSNEGQALANAIVAIATETASIDPSRAVAVDLGDVALTSAHC